MKIESLKNMYNNFEIGIDETHLKRLKIMQEVVDYIKSDSYKDSISIKISLLIKKRQNTN